MDVSFFSVCAAVGVTAFTVLFTAAQFRWDQWAHTRLGKTSFLASLFELFTVTVVSLAIVSGTYFGVAALGCFLIGYLLALEQRRAFRRHPATFRSPGDRLQNSLNVLPFLSYGALGVSAVWPLQPCERNRVVIAVCVWLVISGCFESFVIMNPNLLEAEEDATLSNRGIKYREMRVKESPCALFEPERVIGQVVLAHEIWGVDQQCLAVAERLARSGYLTILPDLYRGLPFLLRIRWIRMSLVGSNGKMRDDILSAREWLKDQGHGDRVGGLGLSLGGTLMLELLTVGGRLLLSSIRRWRGQGRSRGVVPYLLVSVKMTRDFRTRPIVSESVYKVGVRTLT